MLLGNKLTKKEALVCTYEPGDPLGGEVVAEVPPLPLELQSSHQVIVLASVQTQHERLQNKQIFWEAFQFSPKTFIFI